MRKLRIFYASDSSPNPWFKSIRSNLWRANLFDSLVSMGHDVVEFDYDLSGVFRNLDPAIARQAAFIEQNRPKTTAALLTQITAAHQHKPFDLFFSYFFDAVVTPDAIDEIKSLGIKTVNWYCNAAHQFHLVREISPHYDFCLVPEQFRLNDYRAIGAHPIYCQEAANPAIYKPYDLPVEFDVTFVGQAYGDRPAYIQHLLQQKINVHVWGHGWKIDPKFPPSKDSRLWSIPNTIRGDPLDDLQLIQMYSRSKINLGFSTCGDSHIRGERIVQVRLRDFEVPMSGGFYMVEAMDELAQFFTPGEEIVFYRSPDELADKIRYYLAHEDARERIRRAGHQRAVREHTWQKRFESAFVAMGL
jgi:spore maturation protein CgeB